VPYFLSHYLFYLNHCLLCFSFIVWIAELSVISYYHLCWTILSQISLLNLEPFFHNHLVRIFAFWQLLDQHIRFLGWLSSAISPSASVFNSILQHFCRVSDDSWSHNSATNIHHLSHYLLQVADNAGFIFCCTSKYCNQGVFGTPPPHPPYFCPVLAQVFNRHFSYVHFQSHLASTMVSMEIHFLLILVLVVRVH
jgi:hypothetical protein